MQKIQGSKFPRHKLKTEQEDCFKRVFKKWCDVSRKYSERWKKNGKWDDVHWWYRERTHIGFFAAAVWQTGGVAIEEYGTGKKKGQKKYKGRCDLCFSLVDEHYIVEAKHVRSKLPPPNKSLKTHEIKRVKQPILKALREACENARAMPEEHSRMGFVFVTPDLIKNVKNSPTHSIEIWKELIEKDPEFVECLFIAWNFPSDAREFTVKYGNRSYYNPGTAIFAARADAY